jgi:transposase
MSYGTIAVGRIDLRRIADLRREWDDGPRLHPSARWRRQQAALSSLVAECRNQCEKSGTDLKFCRGPFTRTCFGCGARQSVSDSALLHRCSECSGVWDQDENAARNILRIASAEGTVHGPSARGSTSAGMDAIPPANQSRAPPSELGIYILKE